MNLEALETQAGAAKPFLKTVANKRRPAILCELRADGIVTTRRESQTIYYSLASDRATKLIGLLDELYCAPDCGAEPRTNKRGKR